MDGARVVDPFALGVDAALYVPRRATEAALDALERALGTTPPGAVRFCGPAGIGRSLLLRVLERELAGRYQTLRLCRPSLLPGGLWIALARELGVDPGYDSKRRVLRLAAELAREGRALLLVIDDAGALPAESLYALLDTARTEPGLRLVLAHSDAESLAGPLPEDVPVVRLDEAMSRAETLAYVEGRLAAFDLPSGWRHRFDAPTVARLHRVSGGIPRRLHLEARALLADAPPSEEAAQEPPRSEAARPPAPGRETRSPGWRARRREIRLRAAWWGFGAALGIAIGVVLGAWLAPLAPGARPSARWLPSAEPPPGAAPAAESPPPAPSAPDVAAAPPAETGAAVSASAVVREALGVSAAPADPALAEAPAGTARESGETAPSGTGEAEVPPAEGGAPAEAAAEGPSAPPASPAPEPAKEAPDERAAPAADPGAPPPVAAPPPVRPPPPTRGPLAEGRLEIGAEVPLEIEIDGYPFGATPLAGLRLRRGEHRILAHYPDGRVAQKTIELGAEDVSVFFR
jgi:AAA domain